MALPEELETLFKDLTLKKYKGTLTADEEVVLADLTERRMRVDTSSAGIAELPPSLIGLVSDLGTFDATLGDMAHKITTQESRFDVVQPSKPDDEKP